MVQARRSQADKKRRERAGYYLLIGVLVVAGAAYWFFQPDQLKAVAELRIEEASSQAQQALEVALHRNDETAIAQSQEAVAIVGRAKNLLVGEDYAGAKALADEAHRIAASILSLQSAKILEAYDAKILIEDIFGDLKINQKPAKAAVFRGQPLKVGDKLETGSRSAVKIYFANGIRLVLNADSELHLQEDLKQVHPANLYLTKGTLSFETKDGPEGAFTHVITDQGSAFIKTNGIGWLETQGKKGASRLLLQAGRGRIENRWGKKDFLSNQHVTFKSEGEPQVDQWLLSSPIPQQPADGSSLPSQTNGYASLDLDWSDVRDAQSYAIQMARDPYFIQLIKQQSLLETSNVTYDNLQSGNYYWRIAAIDAQNRQGPYSRAANFRIMPPLDENGNVRSNDPPLLKIKEAYVQGYYLLIWGESDRDAVVYVNQEQAVLDHDTGSFFYTTSLPNAGDYTINVRAEDAHGNASEKKIPVTVKN